MMLHLLHKWQFVKEYGMLKNKYKFVCSCGRTKIIDDEDED